MHRSLRSSTLLLSVVLAACSPHVGPGGLGDGGLGDGGDGSVVTASSLTIIPATSTLQVTEPSTLPTLQLTAMLVSAAGSQATSASWTVDRFDIAGVDGSSGLLSAAGTAYGVVIVTAATQGLTATATITVELAAVVNAGGATMDQISKLDGASTTDPAVAGLLYPYDKTVFPRALLAPELMWKGGADADLYRVHLSAPHFDLLVYTAAANPSRYTPPQPEWAALGASAAGGQVTTELRRLDTASGTAYVSATQTWTLADANLRGSIYYWAVSQGQIVQLDVSTGTRTTAFDSGPSTMLGTPTPLNSSAPVTPPWEDNGTGGRCVACHAVSKSGNKLGAVFTRASSAGPVGFVDLATKTTTAIGDYTTSLVFTALTPDGAYAVANYGDKSMKLIDTSTGLPVASLLDGMADICDPAFSPDGLRFAMSASCDPGFGYPVEFRTADLVLYDFAEGTKTFSSPRTVQASSGVGDAIAFPTFSPDATQIFYQRGDYSRAKYGDTTMGMYLHGVDDLYVSTALMGGAQLALDAANGKDVLPADSLHLNYAPTVNPISSGGYTWVVFTSPRDYGNRMQSPAQTAPMDATYQNRKQLWVTAVDAKLGTVDPSHPAFWLPGQDMSTINMFGYWALSPCKPTSGDGGAPTTCAAGFECCSGYCRDTGSGPMCVDAPSGCHQEGEKCTTSSDCCSGGSCTGGICQPIVQ